MRERILLGIKIAFPHANELSLMNYYTTPKYMPQNLMTINDYHIPSKIIYGFIVIYYVW